LRNAAYREWLVSTGPANVKRFSVEHVAAQYAKIYEKLGNGQ